NASYHAVPAALETPASLQRGQEAVEEAIPQRHHLDGTVRTQGTPRQEQVDHRSDDRNAHRHSHEQDQHDQHTVSIIVSGRPAGHLMPPSTPPAPPPPPPPPPPPGAHSSPRRRLRCSGGSAPTGSAGRPPGA